MLKLMISSCCIYIMQGVVHASASLQQHQEEGHKATLAETSGIQKVLCVASIAIRVLFSPMHRIVVSSTLSLHPTASAPKIFHLVHTMYFLQ